MTAFEHAVAFVLDHEGGLVENPVDPGGLTNHGISQRAYPTLDIRALTREQATELYRVDYWLACRCNDLPPAVAILVFDAAVNQGSATAAKLLQRALDVSDDGVIGPATLARANAAPIDMVVVRFTSRRIQRYVEGRGYVTFGAGWITRALECALAAHDLAREAS